MREKLGYGFSDEFLDKTSKVKSMSIKIIQWTLLRLKTLAL